MPRICITVVGDPRRDSRCLRFARALAERHEVTIVALAEEHLPPSIDGMPLLALRRRAGEALRPALWRFWREGARAARDARADLHLASDLYSLPAAAAAARSAGTPLVYDSRELYSDIAALRRRPLAQWYWRRVEARHARRAAAVTTVCEGIADILARRFPGKPVRVLRNLPSAAWSADAPAERGGGPLRRALGIEPGEFLFLSQGGVQAGRGAFTAIDALAAAGRGVLVFLGDGALAGELRGRAERAGVARRVFHHPAVPSDELPRWTAGADAGLCAIEDLGRSYRLSLPNKLFEYIAAGVPVIASDLPEMRRVIDAHGVGLAAAAGDAAALADAMRRMASDDAFRRACAERCLAARAALSWPAEQGALLELCDSLLAARR